MKKLLAHLVEWFYVEYFRSDFYSYWSQLYRLVMEWKYRNVEIPQFKTIDELRAVVKQFKYSYDTFRWFDSVSTPQATYGRWAKGVPNGDCDDVACFNANALRKMRKFPFRDANWMVVVTWYENGKMQNHCTCMFYDWNGYHLLDYSRLFDYSSLHELVEGVVRLYAGDKGVPFGYVLLDPQTLKTFDVELL